MTHTDPTDSPSYRMLVTTTDDKGRKHTQRVPHIPADQLPAARQAVRGRMPRGSVYDVKVIAND